MGSDPPGGGECPLDGKRLPPDKGGTFIDSNVSTPLKLNDEKLDMADLPGQLSVGDLVMSCPVVRTELNENEAELSVIGETQFNLNQLTTLTANSLLNMRH